MDNKKIIIAIDSFKGSATSLEVGTWVSKGIKKVLPKADTKVFSIADGGEGTLDSLINGCNGQIFESLVHGPLGQKITARFGMIDQKTAVIEMAEASGLSLTTQNEQDALNASTFGVGELISQALDKKAKTIYIGLGGSATTDAGIGMAEALGARFTDETGNVVQRGAIGLRNLAHVSVEKMDPRLKEVKIKILSDVTNPLYGKNGAAYIYGPQKGISEQQIARVDSWLENYSEVISRDLGIEIGQSVGGGAAGGLGAGLLVFTNAQMTSGIENILDLLNFEHQLNDADLVITGEGRMDDQSIQGKAPIGIAKLAKEKNLPVIAIVATLDEELSKIYDAGIDLVLSLVTHPMDLETAIKEVEVNAIHAGETAIRAFLLNNKIEDGANL